MSFINVVSSFCSYWDDLWGVEEGHCLALLRERHPDFLFEWGKYYNWMKLHGSEEKAQWRLDHDIEEILTDYR